MGGFRAGRFDRAGVPAWIRPFTPAASFNSLSDIPVEDLWEEGKRLILLDVDHTLIAWKSEEFDPAILNWVDRAKGLGFQLCLLSNTHRPQRLYRLCERLGVETFRGRRKPSREMFQMALEHFQKRAEEAVMIGDQLMTDVWGANRAGVDAIWVQKMAGPEFAGTRLNRFLEGILSGRFARALIVTPEELDAPQPTLGFWSRPIVRQFLKFCVVGGSSFLINYMVRLTLLFGWDGALSRRAGPWLSQNVPALHGASPTDAFFPVASGIAAGVAMLNSFLWNRAWTFRIRGKENRIEQLRRFVAVSLIGALLDVAISTFLNSVLPFDPKNRARAATILSAALVAFWNFFGQRMYAFRAKAR